MDRRKDTDKHAHISVIPRMTSEEWTTQADRRHLAHLIICSTAQYSLLTLPTLIESNSWQLVPFPSRYPRRRSLSTELSGGEVAAMRASSATGEDRISALPDELLLLILLSLFDTAEAARTSVLSRRWRPVWTQLPHLRVPFFPEPLSFRRALRASQLRLGYLGLGSDGARPESMEILLHAAARRHCGFLFVVNRAPDPEPDWMLLKASSSSTKGTKRKMQEEKDWIDMPCFEKACRIVLNLGFLYATIPSAGVFAQLTDLVLQNIQFSSPCELGDAVSWPRCPRLQMLKVCHARGLRRLAIYSGSLLKLELVKVRGLLELTVEAAALKELIVTSCFPCPYNVQLVATISAPRLVVFKWSNLNGQRCIELGQVPHLQYIGDLLYFVYGDQGPIIAHNSACMKLLRRFKAIKVLSLTLAYQRGELSNYEYVMEDMKVLPDHEVLYLNVVARGHSFGASSYHVLTMSVGIRILVLKLFDNMPDKTLFDNLELEAYPSCPPGCACDQQSNWKLEELSLINLQKIVIVQLRGSEHEVSFVKRLINWATALNKMTVFLDSSITESKARELYQMFESLRRPGVCMELYRNKKVSYAP